MIEKYFKETLNLVELRINRVRINRSRPVVNHNVTFVQFVVFNKSVQGPQICQNEVQDKKPECYTFNVVLFNLVWHLNTKTDKKIQFK